MPIQFNSHNHNDNNAIDYNEYSPVISDLAICTWYWYRRPIWFNDKS